MIQDETDGPAMRRAIATLLVIGGLEAVPLALSFSRSSWPKIRALYDPLPAGPIAIFSALGVAIAFIAYATWALPLLRAKLFDISMVKLLAVPFALITGTMEELWFRQALMNGIATAAGGVVQQVVASALLFGFVHAIWGLVARRWRAALGAMVATSILGLALALVYLIAGRHVAPCVWSHILINLCIEPWLLLVASSGMVTRYVSQRHNLG